MSTEKERRKTNRTAVDYNIFCTRGKTKETGMSCDISESGIGFYTNLDLQIGEKIEVQIFPKDEYLSITFEGEVRYRMEAGNNGEYKYRAGVEFADGLNDYASDQLLGKEEKYNATWSQIIEAPKQKCYDVICDFENYPSWLKITKSIKIIERDSDSRPVVVEMNFDFILKTVRTVNKYEYFDKDFILSWKTIDGDIKEHQASYTFHELRPNRTNTTLTGYIVPGIYIPRRAVDYITKVTIRKALRALKKEAESS